MDPGLACDAFATLARHDSRWGGDFLTQMDAQLAGVERVGFHALLELPCIKAQL